LTFQTPTGDGGRPFLGGVRSSEAGEGFGRVSSEDDEDDVGRAEELRRLRVAAVAEHATGSGRRRAVTDCHRVETRRVLHCRLNVKVLERQQHFLRISILCHRNYSLAAHSGLASASVPYGS